MKRFQQRYQPVLINFVNTDTVVRIPATILVTNFISSIKPYYLGGGNIEPGFADVKREELLLILLNDNPEIAGLLFDFGIPEKINLEEFMNRNYRFHVSIDRFAYLTGRSISAFKRDFREIFNDTLQAIINQAGTSGNIFYNARSVNKPLAGSRQLDVFLCSDDSYWYRYFTTGDTLFNVYVSFPAYIPKYMRSSYHVTGPAVPLPYDSLNRSFNLRLVRTGTTDTILAYGRTSFVIGKTIELDNVLLGNPVTTANARVMDTFNNCERQLLYSRINHGIVTHKNYIDSVRSGIRGEFVNYLAGGAGVKEELQLGYWNNEFNYTLYNYDRAGNLILTVPPMGNNPIANTGHLLDDVDTARANNIISSPTIPVYNKKNTYEYTSTNQVKEQNTIDGGTTKFYYDAAGRLMFSQNAKQAGSNMFTYNIYDKQSRVIETGQRYWPVGPLPYEVIHSDRMRVDDVRLFALSGGATRYDVVLTIYDTTATDLATISGLDAQQNLRKRVSCVKYFRTLTAADVNYANYEHATHYSYDMHGNVQMLVQDFPELDDQGKYGPTSTLLQRYKRIDYDYDQVSGKVNMLSYNRGRADQFYQMYEYDLLNRITKVQTSNNGYIWQQEAEYKYYQHGPLARTVLGNPYVQGLDYAYTIQGWLKSLNSDTINSALDMGTDGSDVHTTKDAVAYMLDYFNGDYEPIGRRPLRHMMPPLKSLYNGNIAAQVTSLSNFGMFDRLLKRYTYDQMNRIIKADYASLNSSGAPSPVQDYRSRYSYDDDGNITSLVRYGNDLGSGPLLMDSLIYNYGIANTNKLTELYDHAPNNYTGVPGGDLDIPNFTTPGTTRYNYDAIGNTISDLVSSQNYIEWNLYNKVVRSINSTDGSELQFCYDGAGNRVTKKYLKTLGSGDKLERKEYYVHDAQGNILATYHSIDTLSNPGSGFAPATRQFYLGEHTVYGSSRLGVKKYFPWQVSLRYDVNRSLPPTAGFTDTVLWQHAPWYSLELQDVIKTDSLNLYGNPHTDSLYMTNLMGQKHYEITDHLGNVLATVSDKRRADSMIGASIPGSSARVATWAPIIPNEFDYYPFGQYMPGRWYGDSEKHCYTSIKVGISTGSPVHFINSWASPGPGTVNLLGGASITFMPFFADMVTYAGGDGASYLITGVAPGVTQTFKFNYGRWATTPALTYFVELKDGTTGALLSSNTFLTTTSVSSWVYMTIAPTSSTVLLEIRRSGGGVFGGGGGGGGGAYLGPNNVYIYSIEYDTVSTTPTLITSTVCDDDGYKYGYNGQMKTNEWAGVGNHTTAKFWEYDARIGRRFNIDPVDEDGVSPYATNLNNPILYSDPDGQFPIETIWDVGNALYDIGSALYHHATGDHKAARSNWTDLGMDAAAVLIPYVPAGASKLVKGSVKIVNAEKAAVKVTKAAEKVVEAEQRVQKAANKSKKVAEAEGVVYKRTNPKTGKEYIGRAESEKHYLQRQKAHDSKRGVKHEYEIVDRAKPGKDLRAAEETQIRNGGGPENKGGKLENKRYEMNDKEYRDAGGGSSRPTN